VQLFLQKVVAVTSPSGGSMNVPQQTWSGPQLFVREHSNCVVVVQAPRSRHVPTAEFASKIQQVCPVEQAPVLYGLQDFASPITPVSGGLVPSVVEASLGIPASPVC
jgi:hypothetical protein